MKKFNKIIAFTLALLFVFSVCLIPNNVYAEGNYETLISSVTNPSTGTIRFTVNIPAKTEIHYNVYAKTQYYNGSCDSTEGVVQNTTTSPITKTISVSVQALGTYEVHAITYQLNSNISLRGWDIDSCISKFTGTIYAPKFTWTQNEIDRMNNGAKVGKLIKVSYLGMLDILLTKGLALGIVYSFEFVDIMTTNEELNNIELATAPRLGDSYQFKFVANSSGTGYTTYITKFTPEGTTVYFIRTTTFAELTRIQ